MDQYRQTSIDAHTWQSLFDQDHNSPHYTVLGKKYFNKLNAIRAAKSVCDATGLNQWQVLKFNCFDTDSDADYSIEPDISYEQLCEQRAVQLRAKYDNIRLWYSGGADSHTTLKAFKRAGIAPDEIVILRNTSIGVDAPSNIETTGLTLPSLNRIQQLFPETKITPLEFVFDINNANWLNKVERMKTFSPITRTMSNAFDICPALMDSYGLGTHCELVGEPKPNLVKKDGKWYTYLVDNQIDTCLLLPNLEMFHWSPDLPGIYIKQCHMLKRHYEHLMLDQPDSHSMTLNKDFTSKNIYLNRFNEWDTGNYSHIHHQYAKMHTTHGDIGTTAYAASLMTKDQYFADYFNRFRETLHKEIFDLYPEYFAEGRIFKNMIGMISRFWCIDEHKCLTSDQLWPLGFGNY